MRLRVLGLAGLVVLLFFEQQLFSQNLEDAVRFSTPQTLGTARFVGMAGSFGALGGEGQCRKFKPCRNRCF